MNLEKGKEIFFQCYGNNFFIDREFGNEYRKCKIPLEIEKIWREEIKKDLLQTIKVKGGQEKTHAIIFYIGLLDESDALIFLAKVIENDCLDIFSSIILLESMRHYTNKTKDAVLKTQYDDFIDKHRDELLKKEISIDDAYIRSEYMKNYEFSKNSIINRINNI